MGIVLKVTHLHLGEELAIKVLLPEASTNPEVTARFLLRRRLQLVSAESMSRESPMSGYCLKGFPSW